MRILRKFGSADFIKVSVWSGLNTAFKVLVGFIIGKALALTSGPAGIAMMSQLSNLSSIVNSLATGSIQNGITKYVAEYGAGTIEQKHVIRAGVFYVLVGSFICSVFLLIGAGFLSDVLFQSEDYINLFRLYSVAVFLIGFNMFFLAILNGEKDFKLYIKISILNNFVGAIISICLIKLFNISGALYALLIGQSFSVFFTVWAIRKKSWVQPYHFFESSSLAFIKKLGSFAIMSLIAAFVVPVGQIVVRSEIINVFSYEEAGIWDSLNRISGMLSMFVITSLSTYYMPRLSEISRMEVVKKEVWNTLKIVLPILVTGVILIYFLRYEIIALMYTSKFYQATNFFMYQLLGDVLKLVGWFFAIVTIAKAKLKYFLILELSYVVYYILVSKYFINNYGFEGVFNAYVLSHALNCILSIVIFFQMMREDKLIRQND